MNQLQKALLEICRTHKLREKILIAPSFCQGHQITETFVKGGGSYINLRMKTLTSLAHEIIDLDLAEASIAYLSETASQIIIEDLFNQIRENQDSYFHALEPKEGMVAALGDALRELRIAGIKADDISPEIFVNEKKGKEIKELFRKYESNLREKHYADDPAILTRAIEKLKAGNNASDKALYLFLSDVPYSPLEKIFINLLPGQKSILPHPKAHGIAYPQRFLQHAQQSDVREITSNREKLPYLFEPEKARGTCKDTTIQLFHAVGRRNEVREVLRRIISSGLKNDEVEIIHTSYDDYAPLIYDLSCTFGMPMTFEEGLPITYTHPGKAALGFLSWLSSNYEALRLRQLITSGTIDVKPQEEDELISPAIMARILRESPIGWGKERYPDILNAMAEQYKTQSLEDSDEQGNHRDFYRRREANARFLRAMLKPILESIPVPDGDMLIAVKDFCTCVRDFISRYSRVSHELDGEARVAIIERLDEIQSITKKKMSFADAINHIDSTIREINVGQSGPASGCLHVASHLSGGRSGRRHTYIMGCDAQTFPGTVMQNPILLDEERAGISASLLTSSEFLKEKLYRSALLLSSLSGNITLSFSSFDVIENRESFPSSILLQIYRLISGKVHASYSEFKRSLGDPAGYVPAGAQLDTADFWIGSFFRREGLRMADSTVFHCYPGLLQGLKAKEARETDTMTEYDGILYPADKELDPRENKSLVISASALEKFARCPFAYFLHYILGVRATEEIEFEPHVWLDAKQRGSLLHELFYRFMKEISDKREKPSVQKHTPLIASFLEKIIAEYREALPPPSEAIFAQEKKRLQKAVQIFLKTEEIRSVKYTPVFFELAFGCEDAERGMQEPVTIAVGSGKKFNAMGRIDRIDKIAKGEYAVTDYKTGSARTFDEKKVFNGGKTIQHALYAIAAEKIVQKLLGNKTAKITESGYLFPTEREIGRPIYPERRDGEFIQLLDTIFDALRAGIFMPTDDEKECDYCDYAEICGEDVVSSVKLKRSNAANAGIELLRQLKTYE